MENKPLVSIVCLVYNHEPYLRQCLDGFVMQQTSFPIEVVIHDDASTDRSKEIIQEYVNKYPHIFNPIFESKNQWSIDSSIILKRILSKIKDVKYVATCEGDDYWTDPLKLQKQVDFMESHPDYAICYHHVRILKSATNELKDDSELYSGFPEDFSINELAIRNCINTNSVLYRNNIKAWGKVIELGPTIIKDYASHLFFAENGLIKRLPDYMGVYREGVGVWSGSTSFLKTDIELLECLCKIHVLLDNQDTKLLVQQQIDNREANILHWTDSTLDQVHALMSSNEHRIGMMITKRFPQIAKTIIKIGNRHIKDN